MKGIAKDHESITKYYGSLFYRMKDQCKKKKSHYIPGRTFQFSSIGRDSPAFII